MKKILAIVLAAVMVLGIATSAMALSWAAPTASSSASPFAIEVIKLGVNADVTGAKYYTVLNEAAAFDYSTIYFAIKLSVPSYANANAYYGNSGFLSGNTVDVTITFTNVSGKGSETYKVPLTDKAQTLWYNGNGFDASWTSSLNNNCGCGNNHIKSAVATGNKEVTIKACVGAKGKLDDIKIDGCYGITEKTFYGVIPCVNCDPVNLSGFLFHGNCAAFDVFFSTNAAGKVTGAYVADKKLAGEEKYNTALLQFNKTLYGWAADGTYTNCVTDSCGLIKFDLQELPYGAEITSSEFKTWNNKNEYADKFAAWLGDASAKHDSKAGATWNTVYYKKDGKFYPVEWSKIEPSNWGDKDDYWFAKDKDASYTSTTETKMSVTLGTFDKELWKAYKYTSNDKIQYGKTWYSIKESTDARLYKQTSATTINCDTNEAAFLNALNHLYALLGFTYADIAAGNVYMNEDILLGNFGFAQTVCSPATWGAYTAAITVATVAEVPATGSVTYVGFAMIVLAIAAAVVTKKVRA